MSKTQNIDLSGNLYDVSLVKRFLLGITRKISIMKKKTEINNQYKHFDLSASRYRTSVDRIRLPR